MPFFSFPDDARWNDDTDSVEFSVSIGEYVGTARVARPVFRRFGGRTVSAEECLASYHLYRTEFERAVEAKIRRRELAEDGNVDIVGRDL